MKAENLLASDLEVGQPPGVAVGSLLRVEQLEVVLAGHDTKEGNILVIFSDDNGAKPLLVGTKKKHLNF